MRFSHSFLLLVGCLSLGSCGNADTKKENPSSALAAPTSAPVLTVDSFPAGRVIKKVPCLTDGSQSYALYLPKKFHAGKKYPVLFLFDAHARGSLPLLKYSDLSDRYGFILVCSNNSKNSLDVNTVINITSTFFNDVTKRLPVDPENMFAGGFSGGARVAIGITLQDPRIRGVIANSAGFDPSREPLRKDVCFIGLVGDEDFNLTEMKNTQVALNRSGTTNDLLIFKGKHDWAPASDMDKAFLLFTLEGIRAKRLERNDSIVNASFAADVREADKLLSGNSDILVRYAACRLMNIYYTGIKPVDKYARLEKSFSGAGYEAARRQEKEAAAREQLQQEEYGKEIQEKDISWWTAEVNRLNQESKTSKDKEKAGYNKRILAYLSLVTFMNANSAMKQDALPQAEHFLTLYRLIDPTNSEWAYLTACLNMRKNDPAGAMNALEEAVKLGFNDLDRIGAQKEFASLQNDTRFNELLVKIKTD
jgi:hypothetical protein